MFSPFNHLIALLRAFFLNDNLWMMLNALLRKKTYYYKKVLIMAMLQLKEKILIKSEPEQT